MYLVARPETQAQELISLLGEQNIPAMLLPLMATRALDPHQVIARINNSQGVLFVSPLAIDFFNSKVVGTLAFSKENIPAVYAVGKSSARRLENILQCAVIYPHGDSGVNGLISQGLLAKISRLTIIGGGKVNQRLADYLLQSEIDYDFISFYQRINCGLTHLELIAKLLVSREIEGIIITSTLLVEYLEECVKLLKIADKLRSIKFITIHSQITKLLLSYGYDNVYQAASSDNQAILNLISQRSCLRAY